MLRLLVSVQVLLLAHVSNAGSLSITEWGVDEGTHIWVVEALLDPDEEMRGLQFDLVAQSPIKDFVLLGWRVPTSLGTVVIDPFNLISEAATPGDLSPFEPDVIRFAGIHPDVSALTTANHYDYANTAEAWIARQTDPFTLEEPANADEVRAFVGSVTSAPLLVVRTSGAPPRVREPLCFPDCSFPDGLSIPEPTALALLGLGVGLVAALRSAFMRPWHRDSRTT